MKTRTLSALFAAALLLFVAVTKAEDDGKQGGNIDGSENFEAKIVLTATADAPADSSGIVKLSAENDGGATYGVIEIKTEGLAAGSYTVAAQLKDQSTVTLGQIDIVSEDNGDDANDDSGDDGEQNAERFHLGKKHDNGKHRGHGHGHFGSESEVALPDGLNPNDIAAITISDSNGTVLLIGDFVNLAEGSKLTFNAGVRVAGASDSGVRGQAYFRATAKQQKANAHLLVTVKGLAPQTSFSVVADGSKVGDLKTNKRGRGNFAKLASPALAGLHVVQVQDADGNTVAEADF